MQSTSSLLPSPMLDGFESISVNAESSSARRQRISMACQYCRHRKIRCCGSAPCRNCTRSGRQCEYTPVPEEVNRATREKKALSKAKPSPATPSHPTFNYSVVPSPMPTYSPFFVDTPAFHAPPAAPAPTRPAHFGHRRTSSAPSFESASWTVPPPAPLLNSPAQLESSAWMYNGWSAALPVPTMEPITPTRAFPSVLEQPTWLSSVPAVSSPLVPQHYQMMSTPMPSASMMPTAPFVHASTDDSSYSYMSAPYSSPYLLPPSTHNVKGLSIQTSGLGFNYTPSTPQEVYYTPYSTPSLSSSSSSGGSSSHYTPSPPAYVSSPTLAPEIHTSQKESMVGLGLGLGMSSSVPTIEHDVFYTPVMGSEGYFSY